MTKQYLPRGRIKWARLAERPPSFGVARPRGAKAEGLRYERALAKALGPQALHGQWIEYEDSDGQHYCQPDLLVVGAQRVLILEVKLTWVPEGLQALRELYIPVCEVVWLRHAIGLVAASRLPRDLPPSVRPHGTLDDAVEWTLKGRDSVLHWSQGRPLRREGVRNAA